MRDPYSLDSRFRGNDTFFVIPSLTGDPVDLDFRFHENDEEEMLHKSCKF